MNAVQKTILLNIALEAEAVSDADRWGYFVD